VMTRFGGAAGGGGLGFSIAADVCRAHHGSLRFRNDPAGFVVELAFSRHKVSHEDD
jgi:signal transduction histidine kinase